MKLQLKVEGIFKASHVGDTSTEEEPERVIQSFWGVWPNMIYMKGGTLPPLKHSVFQLETKFNLGGSHLIKKKEPDTKKFYGNLLKPTLSNQSLISNN